jgi:hypothetical protein
MFRFRVVELPLASRQWAERCVVHVHRMLSWDLQDQIELKAQHGVANLRFDPVQHNGLISWHTLGSIVGFGAPAFAEMGTQGHKVQEALAFLQKTQAEGGGGGSVYEHLTQLVMQASVAPQDMLSTSYHAARATQCLHVWDAGPGGAPRQRSGPAGDSLARQTERCQSTDSFDRRSTQGKGRLHCTNSAECE